MAQIEWDDAFTLGNDAIDRQHRKWIELYNTLDGLLSVNEIVLPTTGTHIDALQIMQEYTLYHFRYEENIMANAGYPGLSQHWRLHKDFDYKIFAYLRKMEMGKMFSNTELLDLLRKWLIDHILHEDMRVKQYLGKKPTNSQNGGE